MQVWFKEPSLNREMVIFLHDNAGNLKNRVDKLRQLSKMGYGFIKKVNVKRRFGDKIDQIVYL